MVNRIKLDIDDRVISIGMLHQRTLYRWAAAADPNELKRTIREYLTGEMDRGHYFTFSGNSDFLLWIVESMLEAIEERSWLRLKLLPSLEWTNIGERSMPRLMNESVGTLVWEDSDIMAFMCLATHRALIKKQQGFIPGLACNITIAGAIATVLKLGVNISLPE